MKIQKEFSDGIPLRITLFFLILSTIFSCDLVETDPDVLTPATSITKDHLYVLPNNSAFIDLSSKIRTNVPVHINITAEPRSGTLTKMGRGLLKYSPIIGSSSRTDSFVFAVLSELNEVIGIDTVSIIIETDTTKLPCINFPIDDFIYDVKQNVPVGVNVLANDYLCGTDSTHIVLEIYQPDNTFLPRAGNATISGRTIIYTANSQFSNGDSVIYKIYKKGEVDRAAYGMVYLSTSSCSFSLQNDSYRFSIDALSSVINLPVLENDSLCYFSTLQANIIQAPFRGSAQWRLGSFTYEVSDTVELNESFQDVFVYQVCLDGTCKTAEVSISASPICIFKALNDSIVLPDTSLIANIDVLKNDSICSGYSKFHITQDPVQGVATIVNGTIVYKPNTSVQSDSLEYEICSASKCSSTIVHIKRE